MPGGCDAGETIDERLKAAFHTEVTRFDFQYATGESFRSVDFKEKIWHNTALKVGNRELRIEC